MKRLLLPFLLLTAFLSQAQSVWYVNGSTATSGDGTSWAQSYQYLDEAFAAASNGDEIWVAMGSYIPGGSTPDRMSWYSPTANFQLYGGFEGTETARTDRNPQLYRTIITGDVAGDDVTGDIALNASDNLMHLMVLDTFITNATIIDGITFTRGKTDDNTGSGNTRRGGGILSLGSPIVNNCRFIENYGWFGGGAYPRGQYAVDFKIRNSEFSDNGGGSGGGMYVVGGVSLEISNCTFEDNVVENTGAGLRIQDTDGFEIRDCKFERNFSSSSGGAINFLRAIGSVHTSDFNGNRGNFGGAIVNYTNGIVDIDSCTFFQNNSLASGAVLSLAFESTTHISNSTFMENKSDASAGCIYIQGGESPGDTTTNATITDCVFELNESQSSSGAIWARYSSVVDIIRSSFIDNLATNAAGAITIGPDSLNLGTTSVNNSIFQFNIAGTQGGAIDVLNADLIVTNSVFNENEATTYGGGIIVNGSDTFNASALIVNCTFNENEAEEGGYEFAAFSGGMDTTIVEVQNSIFRNSNVIYSTEAGSPTVLSLGGNVVAGTEDSVFTLTTDITEVDPDLLFVDPGEDLRLIAGSPAIDIGISNMNTPTMDIVGFLRDASPDAGAYEFDMNSSVSDLNSGLNDHNLAPNPTRDEVTITFELEDQRLLGSAATIAIYDLNGILISQTPIQIVNKRNTYALNASSFLQGSYVVQIITKLGVSNQTLVKL